MKADFSSMPKEHLVRRLIAAARDCDLSTIEDSRRDVAAIGTELLRRLSANDAPIGGVAVVYPQEAQEILANPKATKEEIERAYAMRREIPCAGHPTARKHPLRFVHNKGVLAEALGLTPDQCRPIEDIVERCIAENKSMRELFEMVGELDISDELWANFLYTYGWWDKQRRS